MNTITTLDIIKKLSKSSLSKTVKLIFGDLQEEQRKEIINTSNLIINDKKHSTIEILKNINKEWKNTLKLSMFTFMNLYLNNMNNQDSKYNEIADSFTESLQNNLLMALNLAEESKVQIVNEHLLNSMIKGLTVVYARRSEEKQSNYSIDEITEAIFNNYDEERTIIVFADSSSSFKDFSFFKALEIARPNKLKVRIYANTRSEIETITRSEFNMRLYIKYAEDNLLEDIQVMGLNMFFMSSLILFITSLNEGKWLSNANTQLYDKHKLYYNAIKNNNLDELELSQKKEVIALIKSNMGRDKTLLFFEDLASRKIANLRKQIKSITKTNKIGKKVLTKEQITEETTKRQLIITDINEFFYN